ncbi:hypothetical protein ES288_A12G202700v1 [Gossypium darwinii]|uniref:Uncharacterized protein n=1 Tax=Gossypium darwinii TaxID=34276 RepID=A0A5D2EB47_GOSDA|nr:hypothetical protein ES288_A12G202700v1 [Gossypium darwinii]
MEERPPAKQPQAVPGMEELVGVCDAWEWCCRGVGWQTSWGGQGSFFLCYFLLLVWARVSSLGCFVLGFKGFE